MSLQWTFIATFLYTEIFLCVLLMLPFISPTRWQKIFKSRLLAVFHSYANLYFNIFIVVLLVLFADAVREVAKYQSLHSSMDVKATEMSQAVNSMKLFRSQRNLYMTGMAVFLSFVMRRLVTLLSAQATLIASNEATTKQAQSASDMAKKLMEEKERQGEAKDNAANEKETSTVEELVKSKQKVEDLKEELKHADANLDAMKSQAESTKKEYDRLLGEFDKLQSQVETLEGSEGSKKDD